MERKKSPGLAALFNFLVWGLGYAYIGIRGWHGLPIILITVVWVIIAIIVWLAISAATLQNAWAAFGLAEANYGAHAVSIGITLIGGIYFGYDAHKKAKEVNSGRTSEASALGGSKCQACSAFIPQNNQGYCPSCGVTLQSGTATQSSGSGQPTFGSKVCPSCKTQNSISYEYCSHCGGKL